MSKVRPTVQGVGRPHHVHAGVAESLEGCICLVRIVEYAGNHHGRCAILHEVYFFDQLLSLRLQFAQQVINSRSHAVALGLTGDDHRIKLQEILDELVESGIVSRVDTKADKAFAYQAARDPEILTIKYVIDALERRGINDIPVSRSEPLQKLSDNLNVFGELIESSPANQRLKDI